MADHFVALDLIKATTPAGPPAQPLTPAGNPGPVLQGYSPAQPPPEPHRETKSQAVSQHETSLAVAPQADNTTGTAPTESGSAPQAVLSSPPRAQSIATAGGARVQSTSSDVAAASAISCPDLALEPERQGNGSPDPET